MNGTTVKPKWIFEIFHGETVYGIHQMYINGSKNRSKFIGTPKGKAVRIDLMNGEKIEKLTFSGLNLTLVVLHNIDHGHDHGQFTGITREGPNYTTYSKVTQIYSCVGICRKPQLYFIFEPFNIALLSLIC